MKPLYTLVLLCSMLGLHAQTSNWEYIAPNRNYFGGLWNNIGDITFADAQTGYATNQLNREILKTINGGDTWEKRPCNIVGIKAQFLTPQIGYVSSGHEISKTVDGADTWQLLIDTTNSIAGQYFWDFTFVNEQRGYVVGKNAVLRTTDGGATWSNIKPTGGDTTWRCTVFLDANTGWIFGEGNYVWKTNNGGDTWTEIPYIPITQPYDYVKGGRFYDINKGVIMLASGYVLGTTDGGQNWLPNFNSQASNIRSVKFNADGLAYANGWDGTGMTVLSTDSGLTWHRITTGRDNYGIHFNSATEGFIADRQQIYKTTDGTTFQTDSQLYYSSPFGTTIYSFEQLTNSKLYAGAAYMELTSNNNGISWTTTNKPTGASDLIKATSDTCYYEQNGTALYRYLNNVQTFAKPAYYYAYATGADSIIAYTVTPDSTVLMQSIDAGLTWQRISAVPKPVLNSSGHWPSDETEISSYWVARFTSWYNGMVAYRNNASQSIDYITTDHGNTWKNFTGSIHDVKSGVILNTKNAPNGQMYCLRSATQGKAALFAYDSILQDWIFVSAMNYGDCMSGVISFLMDFEWSADSILWTSMCNGAQNYLYYSFDNGFTWNNTHSMSNYIIHMNRTYSGRLLAITNRTELLEHNGQFNNNRIKGSVYYDFNKNNVKDSYDVYALNHVVNSNGNESGITSSDGNYIVLATVGTHTVQPQLTGNYTSSPATRSVSITQQNTISTGNDFALQPVDTTIADLQIGIVPELQSAPGFEHIVNLYCSNNGVKPLSPVITYVLDPVLTFASSNPAPTSQSGDTLRWNLGNLNPLQSVSIHISAMVAVSATLGNAITHKAMVEPIAGDFTPGNNTAAIERIIAGSYDPNMKEVTPDSIPSEQAYKKTSLQYTVHFQNTGTAPAHFVIIKDRLSPKLNWSSLRIVSASHSNRYHIEDKNLLVVTFENIMLPDSTNNEAESHGYVSFLIEPLEDNISTNAINNYADIYFDYNSPITTNTARVIVSSDLNTDIRAINEEKLNISVFPNPTNSIVNLQSDKDFTCILRDVWGREILQSTSAGGLLQFSVNNLSAGMYYLQVTQNGITQAYSLSVINR